MTLNATGGTIDIRSELGARFDVLTVIGAESAIVWRARAAWAMPASNSALASAGAELRVTRQLSLTGKFDSQIARSAQAYAGTGTVRYVW